VDHGHLFKGMGKDGGPWTSFLRDADAGELLSCVGEVSVNIFADDGDLPDAVHVVPLDAIL
jgi:hypothetical protein